MSLSIRTVEYARLISRSLRVYFPNLSGGAPRAQLIRIALWSLVLTGPFIASYWLPSADAWPIRVIWLVLAVAFVVNAVHRRIVLMISLAIVMLLWGGREASAPFAIAFLLGTGLLAIGLEAHKQNRPLFLALRTGKTHFNSLLWNSFVVWSPMVVTIAILLGIAYAISRGTTELAYRYTTLDEFCEVQGMDSPVYVACTGMGNELAAEKIKQLNPRDDIERQLFRHYQDARKRLLHTPLNELQAQAKDRPAFMKTFLPAGVLGLPPSIEDDFVLSRLMTERRRLLESPIPIPSDIVEILSYRQSVDTRNRILRDLNIKISERRKALYAAKYDPLTPDQKLLHQRKDRILLLLRWVNVTIDPAVQAALLVPANETPGISPGQSVTNTDLVRKGLVRSLAHSERDAWEILSREIDTPAKAAIVYNVLGMVPECTVASENSSVRFDSNDFNRKVPNAGKADQAIFTTDNGGSFPCFGKHDAKSKLKLVSVGFRKSVLLSIDRSRDEAAFDAFKKLALLERKAAAGAIDAKTASQEVASVVPIVIPLGRQDCGLFHPINCLVNAQAAAAEAAYTRSRNELMGRFTEQADTHVDASEMTIQQSIDNARVTADAEVSQMHAAGYMAAESFFKLTDVLHALGWIALFLIAFRSFLYVFALELFDRDGELRISFDLENHVEGTVVSGPEVTIDRDFPFPIINKGSLTNTLADIKFAPWRGSAPFARILHGCYFLFNWSVFSPPNKTEGAEQVKGMEASARSGYSIVEWRMQPGEEVIFNYKDFYGASVNVQLKTDISLRLSTLLLGKVFFHYARCVGGEGRLLLEARIHHTMKDSMSSVKPTRLVAWNRHAQFTADSHRHPWKTMINPYTIVRESTPGLAKGLVIIAPESESPQFFGVGIRFLKRIFSRIF